MDIFLVIHIHIDFQIHIHIHIQSRFSCSVITGHEHKGKTSLVTFHILQNYEEWRLKQEKSRASHKNKSSPSLRSTAWCSSLKLYLFICAVLSHSVMSNSLQPHWLLCPWPTRFLCPWGFSRQDTGVGCHALLQGIFSTQGLNPGLPHCRWIFLPSEPPGELNYLSNCFQIKHLSCGSKTEHWVWGHLDLYPGPQNHMKYP